MKKHRLMPVTLFALALTLAVVAPLRAAADDDDPPSRVARLSYTHGAVSFQPAGTEDWVEAVVNRPITTGDKIWADRDARAELHIGSASLRISNNTGFSFLNLSDNVTQVQLTAGDLRIRVKRLDPGESFEIDTPNLAFSLLRPGTYRISVNEAGDTTVIKVRGGEGEVTGGGGAYTVRPQEIASFFGTDQLEADIQRYHSRDDDDFDDWCADRDHREDRALSARYVSPDVVGYEDLDDYGNWRPVPGYGTIWFPRTTIVGWAPYRYGHWAYIPPWGYTWVDDAPWGFAPFHYGRWVFVRGAWGWVPAPPPVVGVTYVRPVYAPALVAWVGGPHFGVGVVAGGGVHVGWFPLGPREVYVPSYRVSRTYVNNVNISNTTVNTTVINNYYNTTIINQRTTVIEHQRYVNQGVPGAVTATTPQVLTSCQPVGRNVVHMDAREVSRAQVSVVAPPVAPARHAVFGSAPAASVRPPVIMETRPVVAKIAPPPAPVPFIRQQQAIQANGGRSLSRSEVQQIRPSSAPASQPNVRMVGAPPTSEGRDAGGFRQPRNDPRDRPAMPATGNANVPFRSNNPAAPAATNNPPAAGNAPPNNRLPVSNNPPAVSNAPPNNRLPVNNNPASTGNPPAMADRPGMGTGRGMNHDRPGNNDRDASGNASRNDRPPANNNSTAVGNPPPNGRFPMSPPPGDKAPASNRPPLSNNPAADNTPPSSNSPAATPRTYNDRPGSARPNASDSGGGRPNPDFDQRRRQEAEDLRARQDREHQREQQEQQDRQRASQRNVSEQKPQSFEPRPQQVPQRSQQVEPQSPPQQPVRVEQKHDQPRPEPRQEQDRHKKDSGSKSDKNDKDKEKDKNDRPH